MSIIHDKRFDSFILILIAFSTLRLIMDTFADSSYNIIFDAFDVVFNFFFYFEFILKVLGEGFIMGEGTYLQDHWNKLDFIIVIVSMIDMQSTVGNFTGNNIGTQISYFKALRLLRTLRPLRFISHNVQLKLIVRSLIDSIEPIINVLLIVLVVFIMFGIAGITLFSSSYHTCYQNSQLYNYPLAFGNFTDILYEENITTGNETEIRNFVRLNSL